MSVTFNDARLRNLKIKIIKVLLENDKRNLNQTFNGEDLKREFHFQEMDIKQYKEQLFDSESKILESVKQQLKSYLDKHYESKDQPIAEYEAQLKKLYLELEDSFKNYHFNDELIERNMKTISGFIESLHWYYLPIYDEVFIKNRDILPETNPKDFYNHYHAVEDMYRWIVKDDRIVKWKSNGGDINLNKKLDFKIYTSRWGHYDNYNITRVFDGWEFHTMHGPVKCKLDGSAQQNDDDIKRFETGIYFTLKHDSVQYPKEGVARAFELLWLEANSTEMKVDTLQKKLNEIANWISEVERIVHEKQPSWCDYY